MQGFHANIYIFGGHEFFCYISRVMAKFQKGNKFAEGLDNSGRPRHYEKTDEGKKALYNRILEYFSYIEGESHEEQQVLTDAKTGETKTVTIEVWDRKPEYPTVTGLSLFLGFSSKSTLYEYAKTSEFSEPIKRALSFVEQHYEFNLNTKASTGAIFALKNFGWKDTQHVENRDITDNIIRPKRPE